MKLVKPLITILIIVLSIALIGCTAKSQDEPLDSDKPITVTIWHYYNGNTKEAFDALVTEFNETIGMEKGIVVDAQSQGDVTQLATAVFEAANETIGASKMPDIFASYADNAFRVHDIVPIAKSSENLYINKEAWETFAGSNGFTDDDLTTWEGINNVAATFYEDTGKSFFSLDANANYFLSAAMQTGHELYTYSDDGTAKFDLPRELAERIWENFYIPYIKGHFVKSGRFSSDDAKTGEVISYTGSTAGAAYFPTTVTVSETETTEISPSVQPYPYFENGKKIAIQQGAGMCISKSDTPHEYASALFLKWFTDIEQNLKFAVSTGYFPVKNEALDASLMIKQVESGTVPSPAIMESIKATNIMFDTYTLYNSKPFKGSYEMRTLLDNHLITKIRNDLEVLSTRTDAGDNRDVIIDEFTSAASFEVWYNDLLNEAALILNNQ